MTIEHTTTGAAAPQQGPLAKQATPTRSSWEAFLARRKAVYEAQLEAMRHEPRSRAAVTPVR
jgi:hypothetical protein